MDAANAADIATVAAVVLGCGAKGLGARIRSCRSGCIFPWFVDGIGALGSWNNWISLFQSKDPV